MRLRDNVCYGWRNKDGEFEPDLMPKEWRKDLRGVQIEQDRFRTYGLQPSLDHYSK